MKPMRLDKYLTKVHNMSRSEAKQFIKKGRVRINGVVEKRAECKIDADVARVELDGERCVFEEHIYRMLNKPAGVVTATKDAEEKTVMDCLESSNRSLFPVGRLDRDTEGLLLITDDGELAHNLLSPVKHIDKCYFALLDGPVGEKEEKLFQEGLDIGDDKKTLPARLVPAGEQTGGFGVYITIQEGRYHQVKRMAKAIGREVLYLKRISMGSLKLDEELKPGQSRPLTREEIDGLKNRV